MVRTIYKIFYVLHLIYSVGKVFIFHDNTEFKRILHITTIFVTTFFVVGAKIRIIFETCKKKMIKNVITTILSKVVKTSYAIYQLIHTTSLYS
jgi:hypothetical protein